MSDDILVLSTHALEQRIKDLRGRLQMFGDEPDVAREQGVDLQFYILIEHLPGFGQKPEFGQVRIFERWLRASRDWRLDYYVYDYERFQGHPVSVGLWGYHCHPLDGSDEPTPHIKCEDSRKRDPHYVGSLIDAHDAIDRFFELDTNESPISSAGLTPIFPGRR